MRNTKLIRIHKDFDLALRDYQKQLRLESGYDLELTRTSKVLADQMKKELFFNKQLLKKNVRKIKKK